MKKYFKGEKKKQNIVIGSIALVAIAVYLIIPELFSNKKKTEEIPKVEIFDDKKEQEESFKALYGERLKKLEIEMETRVKKLEEENERLKKKLQELEKQPRISSDIIKYPDKENTEKQPQKIAFKTDTKKDIYGDFLIPPPPPPTGIEKKIVLKPQEIVKDIGEDITKPSTPKIVVEVASEDSLLEVPTVKNGEKKKQEKKTKKKNYKILPGSFVKARVINGFNAYTGMSSTGKPSPVLLVITDEVQLPNDYTLDLRGCFLKGAATGDLSSKRAKIRIEELSCMDDKGRAIVKKVKGSVNGPDGQEGILGKVVYKQTEVLRNSVIAGALEGISRVMQLQASTLIVSPQGMTTGINPSQAFNASLFGGAESMAKTLSKFYGKILDLTFPVIDVPAGVPVEVLFLSSVELEDGGK